MRYLLFFRFQGIHVKTIEAENFDEAKKKAEEILKIYLQGIHAEPEWVYLIPDVGTFLQGDTIY